MDEKYYRFPQTKCEEVPHPQMPTAYERGLMIAKQILHDQQAYYETMYLSQQKQQRFALSRRSLKMTHILQNALMLRASMVTMAHFLKTRLRYKQFQTAAAQVLPRLLFNHESANHASQFIRLWHKTRVFAVRRLVGFLGCVIAAFKEIHGSEEMSHVFDKLEKNLKFDLMFQNDPQHHMCSFIRKITLLFGPKTQYNDADPENLTRIAQVLVALQVDLSPDPTLLFDLQFNNLIVESHP